VPVRAAHQRARAPHMRVLRCLRTDMFMDTAEEEKCSMVRHAA